MHAETQSVMLLLTSCSNLAAFEGRKLAGGEGREARFTPAADGKLPWGMLSVLSLRMPSIGKCSVSRFSGWVGSRRESLMQVVGPPPGAVDGDAWWCMVVCGCCYEGGAAERFPLSVHLE